MADFSDIQIVFEKPFNYHNQPIFELEFLTKSGRWVSVLGKFDSGADFTFFGKNMADLLEINQIESGKKILCGFANEESDFVFCHRLLCRIPNYEKSFSIEVLIHPKKNKNEQLIGRKDFLDQFGVILNKKIFYLFVQ